MQRLGRELALQALHELPEGLLERLEAGADIFEVSRALSHASIATIANVYGHWTSTMAERSAEPMSEILGG